MKNHDLYESMKEEARLILSETKRFQTISEKNPISYEAADLLANLRNRLNAFEHMTDEAGRIMRDEAQKLALKNLSGAMKSWKGITFGMRDITANDKPTESKTA
ncbi:hypothetical protein EIZ25_07340 [Escherichia coli]|nr:hypothetical protein [Escherichia coli]